MKNNSIKAMLKQSNIIISLIIVVPLVFNVIFYTRQILVYKKLVANVSQADEISEIVKIDIVINTWDLVTGQASVSNLNSSNTLNDVRTQLQKIKDNATRTQEISMIDVSLRTLQTIEDYLEKIIYNIENKKPVKDNEEIMEQIVSVNDLLYSVLQEYVRMEINYAAEISDNITYTLIGLTIFQLLIFSASIFFIRRNQKNMSSKIEHPINDLVVMSQAIASGNLSYQSPPPNVEELEELTNSLNIMVMDLKNLLKDNADKQYNLAQSELKVLQAQITPHFIYNTLDAIISLTDQGSLDDVKMMTFALSDFLRISLSKGQDWIPIEKEIRHIEDYLIILKMRYGASLEYNISIPESMMQITVLKMILQPLVENAVYHGTKVVRRKGLVEIIGYESDTSIVFEIKDNGIGMNEEKIKEVKSHLSKTLDTKYENGYGLYNVNRRIILYYGTKANIQIESEEFVGTTMRVILPKEKMPIIKGDPLYV